MTGKKTRRTKSDVRHPPPPPPPPPRHSPTLRQTHDLTVRTRKRTSRDLDPYRCGRPRICRPGPGAWGSPATSTLWDRWAPARGTRQTARRRCSRTASCRQRRPGGSGSSTCSSGWGGAAAAAVASASSTPAGPGTARGLGSAHER